MTDTDTEELRAALAAPIDANGWEDCYWDGHAPSANFVRACRPDRIARLLDALDEARKDAQRYRWLRDGNAYRPEECACSGGDDLDEICDAAIAAMKEAP